MSPVLGALGVGSRAYGLTAPSGDVPAFEFITAVSGTGSSGRIDFTSIPQTYKHLQIRGVLRGSTSNSSFGVFYNNDNSDYGWQRTEYNTSGTTNSNSGISASYGPDNVWANGSDWAANYHSSFIMDIVDYTNTNKFKTATIFGGGIAETNGHENVGHWTGLWNDLSAINQVTIFQRWSGYWTTTSRFSLYGVKG